MIDYTPDAVLLSPATYLLYNCGRKETQPTNSAVYPVQPKTAHIGIKEDEQKSTNIKTNHDWTEKRRMAKSLISVQFRH